MKNELIMAINNICVERELEPQVVFEAIEAALVSAHRRRFGSPANVRAKIDPKTGEMKIFIDKEVVSEVHDERMQISLAKARAIDTTSEIGSTVAVESTPADFGRIAAQTAKQVILQRIREAERDAIYQRYHNRIGEIVHCTIRSIDHSAGTVTASIDGKAEGVLAQEDQIPTERYRPNGKLRCYLVEVGRGTRGPVIRLSRTHRGLLRRLLEQEVPEIYNGSVEIKSIAREPGQRSKVAVAAIQPGVDPVGSCVGMRGVRIQAIVNELNGEKIDVVEWNPDSTQFISNALSPAKVSTVILDDTTDNRTAIVVVPDRQLSLAIGKEGQNARLSAKLTGWRIDIKSESEAVDEGLDELARELAARRARLAMARARAESADILSVAEQLLRDEEEMPTAEVLAAAPAVEPEVPAEAAVSDEAPAEAPEVEGAEPTAGVAETYDEYDEYGEYDEYSDYDEYEEYDEYDEYSEYDEYDEYGEYDEHGEYPEAETQAQDAGSDESAKADEPSSLTVAAKDKTAKDLPFEDDSAKKRDREKERDKKRQLVYNEDLGEVVAVHRSKRGQRDWRDYQDDE